MASQTWLWQTVALTASLSFWEPGRAALVLRLTLRQDHFPIPLQWETSMEMASQTWLWQTLLIAFQSFWELGRAALVVRLTSRRDQLPVPSQSETSTERKSSMEGMRSTVVTA